MKASHHPEFPVSPQAFRMLGRGAWWHWGTCIGVLIFLATTPANGIAITSFTAMINDRFASGFPGAPVANADVSFAGAGLDWAGVGWATSDPTKGFGFLSPSHYLVARHYGGATNLTLALNSGTASFAQAKVEDTGYGALIFSTYDLALGTLATPLPTSTSLPRYGVLDLNSTSTANTPDNYLGLQILAYGRGPDGATSPRVSTDIIVDHDVAGNTAVIATYRTDVQLEGGDSGSPTLANWTNPNGGKELTVLGNNAGINALYNGFNFLGTRESIAALNTLMNDDGRALRVVGNPASSWSGTASTDIGVAGAWTPGGVPTDVFVTFDASTAGNGGAVNVNTDQNLRGLFFKATVATNDGFAISGSNFLTIGRGGITNYDADRQTLTASITLGSSQYWDAGSGGITTAAINTNGNLLEIAGTGTSRIDGEVSGSGGIALSSGTLVLSQSNNTYTGNTWVHGGYLVVDGNTPAASLLTIENGAALNGSGVIGGATTVLSGGRQSPGAPGAVGTQQFASNLTFSNGSIFEWEINTTSAGYDKVTVGGTLTIGAGALFQISSSTAFSDPFWNANHQWGDIFGGAVPFGFDPALFLFSATGSLVAPPNSEGSFSVAGTELIWTAVPEPPNWLAASLLALGLWRRQRS